jgi:hypothetical protein
MDQKRVTASAPRPPTAIAVGAKFNQKGWFRQRQRAITLNDAINFHSLTTGISRMGKSKWLEMQAVEKLTRKPEEGVVVIDSHASTSTAILHACIRLGVPPDRVILIDLTSPEYGVPRIWLLDAASGLEYVVIDGLVSCFREIFGRGIADRAADILTQLFRAIQKSHTPFTLANRFLLNARFRHEVLEKCEDEELRDFWVYIFGMRNREIVESSRNKINALSGHDFIRPMLQDTFNTISFFDALNDGKIIIINLDHAYFGLYSRGLLGSIFLFLIYQAAIKRKPTEDYRKVSLFLDEFHEYAVPEFYIPYFTASAKYNVGINIYTQTLDRFDAFDLNTILGNVGVITSFAVGHKDATLLTPNMITPFGENIKKQKRDIYSLLGFDKGYGEATYYSTGEEERNFHHELMNQTRREIITRIKGTDDIALYYSEVAEAPEYHVTPEEEHEYRLASCKGYCLPVNPPKKEEPKPPPKRTKWKRK